jgi:hypothetical protein
MESGGLSWSARLLWLYCTSLFLCFSRELLLRLNLSLQQLLRLLLMSPFELLRPRCISLLSCPLLVLEFLLVLDPLPLQILLSVQLLLLLQMFAFEDRIGEAWGSWFG